MLAIQWGLSGRFQCGEMGANCLDAVDEGGTDAGTLRESDQGIRITSSDNGKGIEAPLRSCIFVPLYTTKGDLGTGPGVAGAPVPD
jgi:C4-dicarboxylate-specific signal transduction histidine kinase